MEVSRERLSEGLAPSPSPFLPAPYAARVRRFREEGQFAAARARCDLETLDGRGLEWSVFQDQVLGITHTRPLRLTHLLEGVVGDDPAHLETWRRKGSHMCSQLHTHTTP